MITAAHDSPPTLRQFFREVYTPVRLAAAAPATVQQYEVAMNRFEKFLNRPATLADLTEPIVATFVQRSLGQGLAPATVRVRSRYLLSLWRFARKRKYTLDDTLAEYEVIRVPTRLPQAWLPEEMDRLIQSARLARGFIFGVPAECWWVALLLVLYDTGLRRTAAFRIQFAEVDWSQKLLRVPAERMKNRVEQFFRLSDQTLAAIAATLPPERRLLFPWHCQHHRALYDRFRVILRRAGLPATSKDLFHKLRRTTASNLALVAGEGLAIQQLGHRDAASIKRYVDPRFTSLHDAASLLPRPDCKAAPEVEVEVVAQPEPILPRDPVKVTLSLAAVTGSRDVLAELAGKEPWTTADLRRLVTALGVYQQDFARAAGVSEQWLCRLLAGQEALSLKVERQLRRSLGLTYRRAHKAQGGVA